MSQDGFQSLSTPPPGIIPHSKFGDVAACARGPHGGTTHILHDMLLLSLHSLHASASMPVSGLLFV